MDYHSEDLAAALGGGGTGSRFGRIIVILAGIAALSATLLTSVSVWLQFKNYRKPLLQRYVVRILFMVPIYAGSSWASFVSIKASFWIDPFRDVYEAFTIYAFFQLLINFLGGERSLIIAMHGRAPVSHPWPFNHCFSKLDISDPYTFLAVKRGILQYAWLKPILSVATIVMKATGTYQEGYIGLSSGYFWSGLIYNISISVSLYALAMFWVCMSADLKPFRPMPKFLCIKGIIFASYWQGFFLSFLVLLGAIPDTPGYSPDNLAAAIQDALICFEMPFFAAMHWYAFSWHDYADITISAARMPVIFAVRDALGPRDLIQDAKETLSGRNYEYRYFDADDNTLAHEDSKQRAARMKAGMRYARDGGKYWIPKPGGASDSNTPLLKKPDGEPDRSPSPSTQVYRAGRYGALSSESLETPEQLDDEDERLFANARALEFGDWNYPVITAHHASREDRLYREPNLVTGSTNRHVLQPTRDNRKRRKSRIETIQEDADKGKQRRDSKGSASSEESSSSKRGGKAKQGASKDERPSSNQSNDSDLRDLVVEDHKAEEIDRVRARKEGSPVWNKHEPRHFVRTYPPGPQEEVQAGPEPDQFPPNKEPHNQHGLAASLRNNEISESDEAQQWHRRDYTSGESTQVHSPTGGGDDDESNPWGQ